MNFEASYTGVVELKDNIVASYEELPDSNESIKRILFTVKWEYLQIPFNLKVSNYELKGFRKGKISPEFLEVNKPDVVGAFLYDISDKNTEAIVGAFFNEKKITNVSRPSIYDASYPTKIGEDYSFKIMYEKLPDVPLIDPSEIEIVTDKITIDDASIEKYMGKVSSRVMNEIDAASDSVVKDGDGVVIDFEGSLNGKKFNGGSSKNYKFRLDEGKMVPDFELGIKGMKVDEVKTINVNFPEDYQYKFLSGKNVQFEITLHKIINYSLITDKSDILAKLKLKTQDEFFSLAKQSLELKVNEYNDEKLKSCLYDYISEHYSFDLPSTVLSMEENKMKETYPTLSDDLITKKSKSNVCSALICLKYAEENEIKIDDEEFKEYLFRSVGQDYNELKQVVEMFQKDPNLLFEKKNELLEMKIFYHMKDRLRIIEKEESIDKIMCNL